MKDALTGAFWGISAGAVMTRTTVSAVFGGLAARATGGSFEDGAMAAAFSHLFNDEAISPEMAAGLPYALPMDTRPNSAVMAGQEECGFGIALSIGIATLTEIRALASVFRVDAVLDFFEGTKYTTKVLG